RDPREALLIQLRRKGKKASLAYKIIDKHFDDLLHNRIPAIHKGLGASPGEIEAEISKVIGGLSLQPGAAFGDVPVQHVRPDGKIVLEHGELRVEVNDDTLPPLRLNRRYLRMLDDPSLSPEDKEYIMKKAMSGRWLLKNIHQRNETLFRILESLTKRQGDFLRDPVGELKPLTMKVVAEELEVHESTVARAVANKYVDCPRGLLPLRFFFSNSYVTKGDEDVSSHSVKAVLSELIDREDKSKPLSDEALSQLMAERGISCARRTVAKYRREMQIGNTSQRRSYAT
ncbi:MAG: RNA polymerase sigma-54 factor, partial [Chlamydiia bacterium]|nr:RNA polymerase sigma-54 factor [Chlamydiia bacterium]